MRKPWEVESSPEVDNWIEELPDGMQRKVLRAVRRIEQAGRQAGYPAIEKYEDDLYSTRIDAWRVFGAFKGHTYYMVSVIGKSKPRLTAREVGVLRDRVQRYLDDADPKGER